MGGLFEESLTLQKIPFTSKIPQCGKCGLFKECKSPKIPLSGKGKKSILVVGEGIDGWDDDEGCQFSGPSGQLLRTILAKYDIELDRDCWKTSALICRETEPTEAQISACRPNLYNAIAYLKPKIIVPMGKWAVQSLLGPLWKEDVGGIGDWIGWKIPLQKWNCWVCPTWSPEYVKYMIEAKANREGPVVRIWFERHLEEMSELIGDRPYEKVPDYVKDVRYLINTDEAAEWIDGVVDGGGLCAFDYETDRLKPDSDESRIVSAAICWRGDAVAFPFSGKVVAALGRFVRADNSKIITNAKFESRWTIRHFGTEVKNVVWDTMLSAHHLDNRVGISGAKFQAFVRLGQVSYNTAAEPFLKADNANNKNRIDQIDLPTLLQYNAMDALVEYLIAKKQREEMQHGQFDGVV